jgi:hypothetical protein
MTEYYLSRSVSQYYILSRKKAPHCQTSFKMSPVLPRLKCPLGDGNVVGGRRGCRLGALERSPLRGSGSAPIGADRTKMADQTYSFMDSVNTKDGSRRIWVRLSGRGTGIPIYGQTRRIERLAMCRKALTKRGFKRILLGTGVAPKKGYNDYGHPKTIQRKG